MLARLTRALLLVTALAAAQLAAGAPAHADDPPIHVDAGCDGYSSGGGGGVVCNVAGGSSTPGSSSTDAAVRATGGTPGCFFNGREIPCVGPEGIATWDPFRQCYVTEVDLERAHEDDRVDLDNNTYDSGSDGTGYGRIPEENAIQGTHSDGSRLWACGRIATVFTADEFMAPIYFWSVSPPPPPLMINPADLVAAAMAAMGLQAIDQQLAPPPLSVSSDSMGLVGLPVWMWTEPTPTTWGPRTASATALGVTVTATVEVDHVEWSMGDGTRKTCRAGTPYSASHGVELQSPDCGHVYERTSRTQSDQAYTVTATSHWAGGWTGGGQAGDVTLSLETSEELAIGEAQAIRTR